MLEWKIRITKDHYQRWGGTECFSTPLQGQPIHSRWRFIPWLNTFFFIKAFLGATKHLYNWLCWLVGRSVGRSGNIFIWRSTRRTLLVYFASLLCHQGPSSVFFISLFWNVWDSFLASILILCLWVNCCTSEHADKKRIWKNMSYLHSVIFLVTDEDIAIWSAGNSPRIRHLSIPISFLAKRPNPSSLVCEDLDSVVDRTAHKSLVRACF